MQNAVCAASHGAVVSQSPHVFYNKPYVLPIDSLIGICVCSWRWCSHCSLVWLSSYCIQLLTAALPFPPEVKIPVALMV